MQNADQGQGPPLNGTDLRIGVVCSRFNHEITSALSQACRQELLALGVQAADIEEISVPGALEIPLVLKVLAERDDFDALIALGCIIRGQTYHFELVANESGAGVTRVSLDHTLPIANAILTVENADQAWDRVQDKGRDAARVAVEMAQWMDELS